MGTFRQSLTVALLAGAAAYSPAGGQALPAHVLAVRPDAPPGGDGLSWATAFNNLRYALDAAAATNGQVTQLWLAQGVYEPPAEAACQGFQISNVSLYGGFAGNEVILQQRPAGTFSTIQQPGCGLEGMPALVISTTFPITLERMHVQQSVQGGVTFQGPTTFRDVRVEGGYRFAVQKVGPGPLVVERCTFLHSGISPSAGISLGGPGTITDSTLQSGGPMGWMAVQLANLTVRRSTIGGGTDAHGMLFTNVTFENCTIAGGGESGTGIAGGHFIDCNVRASSRFGNALAAESVTRCMVTTWTDFGWAFTADSVVDSEISASVSLAGVNGGGAAIGTLVRSRLEAEAYSQQALALGTVVDSWVEFFGKVGGVVTGAAKNSVFVGSGIDVGLTGESPQFINCLFNVGGSPGPAFAIQPGWEFTNCIIWRPNPGVTEASTFSVPPGLTGFANYSCIRGWTGQYGGIGNIAIDPMLNADGTLQPGSPCIDAGTNAVAAGARDRLGNCRISDGDQNGTSVIDMGPHEVTLCWANCDCSTTPPALNVMDFVCFLQNFQAGSEAANCDGSWWPPVLNAADFSCFLQKFAAGCP